MKLQHIGHSHYRISDAEAGRIVKAAGLALPKPGWEMTVPLPGLHGVKANILRTPYRHHADAPKRGWVWCLSPRDHTFGQYESWLRWVETQNAKSGGGGANLIPAMPGSHGRFGTMPTMRDAQEAFDALSGGGGARAKAASARVKSPTGIAQETEFWRRHNLPGCEVRYVGPHDVVLMALGHELGSKTSLVRRGKEVDVLYVLPSLARYEALLKLPVAKSGGGAKSRR